VQDCQKIIKPVPGTGQREETVGALLLDERQSTDLKKANENKKISIDVFGVITDERFSTWLMNLHLDLGGVIFEVPPIVQELLSPILLDLNWNFRLSLTSSGLWYSMNGTPTLDNLKGTIW